uniref:terminase small subunit n=1 Tax=Candidatus Scatousia sp. TaxID=3085663 RepID=UPI004028A34F
MKRLTKQQKIFIDEYIKTVDGELSAKNAGYKGSNLKETANRLLSNDLIIREMNIRLKGHIKSLRVDKGYVIQKLLQIAEFSLEEEDITDKDGSFTGKKKLRDT